jgi:hypothetical protein
MSPVQRRLRSGTLEATGVGDATSTAADGLVVGWSFGLAGGDDGASVTCGETEDPDGVSVTNGWQAAAANASSAIVTIREPGITTSSLGA